MMFNDINKNVNIKALILMNQDIAKSDHNLHILGKRRWNRMRLRQNLKTFFAFLGQTEVSF
jgi:hypothetical protein